MRTLAMTDLLMNRSKVLVERFAGPVRMDRELRQRKEEIERDPRLTDEGKKEAKADAAKATLVEFRKWSAPVREGINGHKSQVRDKMLAAITPAAPTDVARRIESALLRAEIRRAAAGLDQAGLELLYRKGDHTVRAALAEVPRIEVKNGLPVVGSYISMELRDQVQDEVAAKACPEDADMLRGIREVESLLQTVEGVLMGTIAEVAPDAIEHPITVLAT